jgi:molecular chaperone DnaK
MPQIEVTFDIDANGILSVKAKDKTTNKEQSIRIEASSGLSDADIEKMRQDAEVNADSDKLKKELIEAQNAADHVIYSAEKAVKEHGDKVTDDIKKNVQEKVDALKTARNGTDMTMMQKATEELSTAMSAIGEAMSKAQSNTAGTGPTDPVNGNPTGDVPPTENPQS